MQDPLRCGQALHNYQLLDDMYAEVVKNSIERARQHLLEHDSITRPATFTALASNSSMRTSFGLLNDHSPTVSDSGARPSPYLRDRCPLCAGGNTYTHEDGK